MDPNAPPRPGLEVIADSLPPVAAKNHDVRDALPAQPLDLVLEDGLVDERHLGLRPIGRQRTQALPLAAGHDQGVHRDGIYLPHKRIDASASVASAPQVKQRPPQVPGQPTPTSEPLR